jgi:hypothetical protein
VVDSINALDKSWTVAASMPGEMLADGAAELNEGRVATARRRGLFGDAA